VASVLVIIKLFLWHYLGVAEETGGRIFKWWRD